MSTLAQIQAAAEMLPPEQQEQLYRFLDARLHPSTPPPSKARVIRQGADVLLEASAGAPPMTPQRVKEMLEDWP